MWLLGFPVATGRWDKNAKAGPVRKTENAKSAGAVRAAPCGPTQPPGEFGCLLVLCCEVGLYWFFYLPKQETPFSGAPATQPHESRLFPSKSPPHDLVPSSPTHGHLFLLESHRSLATTYLFPEICSRNLAPTFRAPLAEHHGRMRLIFVGSLACLGAHHHRRRNHECHSGGIVEELVS